MKDGTKLQLKAFSDETVNLFVLSVLTGVFSGIIVTFYNILTVIGEEKSVALYKLVLENPAFIPVLFLGLAAGSLVIGTIVRFVPTVRGSGIPQTEGASRGIVPLRWYITLCTMFATSLACVFLGYAAGAEGPSVELGACVGGGSASLLKRNSMTKRLQIAAGSSAGFAVAFNAPLTGVVFAMEEAFRAFSPRLFVCSAVSVICALFTRNSIRPALGFEVGFSFENFVFCDFDAISYLYLILASVITALLGVAFYHLVFVVRKLMKRITFLKGIGKFQIPFVLAGAFGLITVYAMGGGHSFIDALSSGGTGEITLTGVFGLGVAVSLLIIVAIRTISAALTIGCGVPCGVFVPMLAIGAGTGALLSVLFSGIGFSSECGDYLVIICMAVFFTSVIKAPVTGCVMVFELTGQFVDFLPALIGVVIGYAVGYMFKTEPLYEKLLSSYVKEEKLDIDCKKDGNA